MTAKRKEPAPKPSGKAEPAPNAEPTPARVLRIKAATPGESRAESLARATVDGTLPLTLVGSAFARGIAGEDVSLTELHARMAEASHAAAAGDLAGLERMLSGQAQVLNTMFCELARRAAMNMGTHLEATETYLRMALKAQSQSRATVQTLVEAKQPRAVAFVKQANIAQQQQVNNGAPARHSHAHARESANPANELLEDATHEQQQRMVPGAQAEPARGDPAMEALGEVHRPEDA
jgi:hypothetical protein